MKIVTDCAADLTPEEVSEWGITVAPLFIQFPDAEVNSDDISADDFYARLKAMEPEIPTTAQPSAEIFTRLYQKLSALGEEIFSIHISSGLSGTIDSARLGASHALNSLVHIFDSLTLSGGQRFQVMAAARAFKSGWSKDAVIKRLEQLRESTEVVYTLDTLKYLARGGRIGRVQALAGTLLHIKPIIRVERADGKYSTVGKARTLAKSLGMIVDHLVQEYGQTPVWVSVMHGQFADQAQALADLARERLNVGRLEVLRISPVLGVHTGPGIVGAAVAPMALLEDIA